MDIQFNVDQALAKLGELVAKHGPEAVNLAASVTQINGVATLVSGAVCALGAIGLGVLSTKCTIRIIAQSRAWTVWLNDHNRIKSQEPDTQYYLIPVAVISGMVGVILSIAAVGCLADVWSWVAVFNPKLALAHQVLVKIGAL